MSLISTIINYFDLNKPLNITTASNMATVAVTPVTPAPLITITPSNGVEISMGLTYIMKATDRVVSVNKRTASTTLLKLPVKPPLWTIYNIKDTAGVSNLFPITVMAADNTLIDGNKNLVINSNWESITLCWMGTRWSIM